MKGIIIATLAISVGFLVGMRVAWQPLPMERIYKEYNHMKVYEDGSYLGETREGIAVDGCLQIALCNEVVR